MITGRVGLGRPGSSWSLSCSGTQRAAMCAGAAGTHITWTGAIINRLVARGRFHPTRLSPLNAPHQPDKQQRGQGTGGGKGLSSLVSSACSIADLTGESTTTNLLDEPTLLPFTNAALRLLNAITNNHHVSTHVMTSLLRLE